MADPAALDDSEAPAVRQDLTTSEIDGELVIFDPATSKIHQLDPLGTVIWHLLDGEASAGELVADLTAGFGVPETQVRTDLAELLANLREHDLLATGSPPVASHPTEGVEPARPEYLVDPPAP